VKGETCPPQRRSFRDAISGNKVWQLTDTPNATTHHLYYVKPTVTPDGEWLIYCSDWDHGHFNLYAMHTRTWESVQLTETADEDPFSGAISSAGDEVFYPVGSNTIRAVNIFTLEERAVCRVPDAVSVGAVSVSGDGAYVLFSVDYERYWEHVRFEEAPYAFPHKAFGYVLAEGGEMTPVVDANLEMSHPQFCPTDADVILYGHEGPWYKVQRMWLIRRDGSGNHPIFLQNTSEAVGHEFWSHNGERIYASCYGGRQPQGLWSVNRENNQERCVLVGPTVAHSAANAEEDRFVADEHYRDRSCLWVARRGDPQPQVLCRTGVDWGDGPFHPHPRFTPDGSGVIFDSARTGSTEVYWVEV